MAAVDRFGQQAPDRVVPVVGALQRTWDAAAANVEVRAWGGAGRVVGWVLDQLIAWCLGLRLLRNKLRREHIVLNSEMARQHCSIARVSPFSLRWRNRRVRG